MQPRPAFGWRDDKAPPSKQYQIHYAPAHSEDIDNPQTECNNNSGDEVLLETGHFKLRASSTFEAPTEPREKKAKRRHRKEDEPRSSRHKYVIARDRDTSQVSIYIDEDGQSEQDDEHWINPSWRCNQILGFRGSQRERDAFFSSLTENTWEIPSESGAPSQRPARRYFRGQIHTTEDAVYNDLIRRIGGLKRTVVSQRQMEQWLSQKKRQVFKDDRIESGSDLDRLDSDDKSGSLYVDEGVEEGRKIKRSYDALEGHLAFLEQTSRARTQYLQTKDLIHKFPGRYQAVMGVLIAYRQVLRSCEGIRGEAQMLTKCKELLDGLRLKGQSAREQSVYDVVNFEIQRRAETLNSDDIFVRLCLLAQRYVTEVWVFEYIASTLDHGFPPASFARRNQRWTRLLELVAAARSKQFENPFEAQLRLDQVVFTVITRWACSAIRLGHLQFARRIMTALLGFTIKIVASAYKSYAESSGDDGRYIAVHTYVPGSDVSIDDPAVLCTLRPLSERVQESLKALRRCMEEQTSPPNADVIMLTAEDWYGAEVAVARNAWAMSTCQQETTFAAPITLSDAIFLQDPQNSGRFANLRKSVVDLLVMLGAQPHGKCSDDSIFNLAVREGFQGQIGLETANSLTPTQSVFSDITSLLAPWINNPMSDLAGGDGLAQWCGRIALSFAVIVFEGDVNLLAFTSQVYTVQEVQKHLLTLADRPAPFWIFLASNWINEGTATGLGKGRVSMLQCVANARSSEELAIICATWARVELLAHEDTGSKTPAAISEDCISGLSLRILCLPLDEEPARMNLSTAHSFSQSDEFYQKLMEAQRWWEQELRLAMSADAFEFSQLSVSLEDTLSVAGRKCSRDQSCPWMLPLGVAQAFALAVIRVALEIRRAPSRSVDEIELLRLWEELSPMGYFSARAEWLAWSLGSIVNVITRHFTRRSLILILRTLTETYPNNTLLWRERLLIEKEIRPRFVLRLSWTGDQHSERILYEHVVGAIERNPRCENGLRIVSPVTRMGAINCEVVEQGTTQYLRQGLSLWLASQSEFFTPLMMDNAEALSTFNTFPSSSDYVLDSMTQVGLPKRNLRRCRDIRISDRRHTVMTILRCVVEGHAVGSEAYEYALELCADSESTGEVFCYEALTALT